MNLEHIIAQQLSVEAENLVRRAATLWELAALHEEEAVKIIPRVAPRTKRIITASHRAMTFKAKALRRLFK